MTTSLSSVGWVDGESVRAAVDRLSDLTIGPRPSRTNPGGGRAKVLDPRSALAAVLPRVADFCIGRIREYTPKSDWEDGGRVRSSYNIRRAFGFGSSKASFDFVTFEIASDLPDAEQVVVSTLEFGSVPHVIRARRRGGFMRIPLDPADVGDPDAARPARRQGAGAAFIVQEDGGPVLYAQSVQHPGTQPHGMFRRTLLDVVPVADQVAKEVVAAVAASWPSPSGGR